MNRKYLAPSIAWLMTIIAAPSFAQDVLSDARTNFASRQYLVVFNSLYDYRRSSEGTLVVDYMLAVSACHLTGQRRTAGGYLLSQLPEWYGPLGDGNWEMVRRQAEACPPPANPAEEPFAGIQGAADDGKSESLLASRSKEGSGDALPAAAVSPPEGMGELMDGQSYAYAGPQEQELTTDSAWQCANVCKNRSSCHSITYAKSTHKCWVKGRVPALSPGGDFVSSRKRFQVNSPMDGAAATVPAGKQ